MTRNFKAIFYTHIWRSSLRQTAKFYSIILKFYEVRFYAILCELTQKKILFFTTHLPRNTTFDIWQQTNGWNAQIAGILQLQKQWRVRHKIFFWKSLHLTFKMFTTGQSTCIQMILRKLSCICCSAPFWSRMVFGFKFVKCLQHCTTYNNSQKSSG